jgi:hypothetical protein
MTSPRQWLMSVVAGQLARPHKLLGRGAAIPLNRGIGSPRTAR